MSAYASHITNLQKKTTIVASEDIFSEKGVLLAKSGVELNQKTCQSILKFKLLKPLENSIAIADQLQAKDILDKISQLIQENSYLNNLNNKIDNRSILEKCCSRLKDFPLLLQKLTVLDMELSEVFKQSILSGYLACLAGILDGDTESLIGEKFLAAIVHDIGFLHISRDILLKKEALTPEEWRNVQSHPIIAYEILKAIPNFPKASAVAVLEHHENLDGSGYPRAKTEEKLGSMGQLISLLDNVIVIFQKKFKPLKRSPNGIIPLLQINMHSYPSSIVSTIFRLLKSTPPSEKETSDTNIIRELIQHVEEQQNYIETIVKSIQSANEAIGYQHKNEKLFSVQKIAVNIFNIINSAGLGHDNIDWLEQLERDEKHQALYSEVEDTRLIQGEIIFQLQSYQKAAGVFINKNPNNPPSKHLQRTIDTFSKTPRPLESKTLQSYWKKLAS